MIKKVALQVALLYKKTGSDLAGCLNDAENLKVLLMENGYTFIRTMTDEEKNKGTTEYPTSENVLSAIHTLLSDTKKGDNVVFTYSGHGSHIKCTDGSESDGEDSEICLYDPHVGFQMITDNQLRDSLVEHLPDGVNLLFISDSCFSGTILDTRYRYNIKEGIHESLGEKPSNKHAISISGCMDNQTSADAYIDGSSQGALTHYFIETFRKMKPNTTLKQFITDLDHALKKAKFSQVSTLGFFDLSLLSTSFSL